MRRDKHSKHFKAVFRPTLHGKAQPSSSLKWEQFFISVRGGKVRRQNVRRLEQQNPGSISASSSLVLCQCMHCCVSGFNCCLSSLPTLSSTMHVISQASWSFASWSTMSCSSVTFWGRSCQCGWLSSPWPGWNPSSNRYWLPVLLCLFWWSNYHLVSI